jgi:hypothetical protein
VYRRRCAGEFTINACGHTMVPFNMLIYPLRNATVRLPLAGRPYLTRA